MINVVFIGHGKGGKSAAAEIFARRTGKKLTGSTSWYMREQIAKAMGLPVEQAWAERRNHRELWRKEYRKNIIGDPAKLIREMVKAGSIIEGLRSRDEFDAAKKEGLFDLVVWVECPWVPKDVTMDLNPSDADIVINNDERGLDLLEAKLEPIIKQVMEMSKKTGLVDLE